MDQSTAFTRPITVAECSAAVKSRKPLTRRQFSDAGFKCMECGRKFRTAAAAQKAMFGDNGCPGCGGSDIDMA